MEVRSRLVSAGVYTLSMTVGDSGGRYVPVVFNWTVSAAANTNTSSAGITPPMRARLLPSQLFTVTAQLQLQLPLATLQVEGGLAPFAFSLTGEIDGGPSGVPSWLTINADGVLSMAGAAPIAVSLDGVNAALIKARVTDSGGNAINIPFTLFAISKPNVSAALQDITPVIAAGVSSRVATVSVDGGNITEGRHTISVAAPDGILYALGREESFGFLLTLFAPSAGVVTATIVADDETPVFNNPASLFITVTVFPQLRINTDRASIVITLPSSLAVDAALLSATISGGVPPYSLSMEVPTVSARVGEFLRLNAAQGSSLGVVLLNSAVDYHASQQKRAHWNLRVRDSSGYLQVKKRLSYVYYAPPVTAHPFRIGALHPLVVGNLVTVLSISASGGYWNGGDIALSIKEQRGAAGVSARIDRHHILMSASATGAVTMVINTDDNHTASRAALVSLTVTIVDISGFTAALLNAKGTTRVSSSAFPVATLSVGGGYLKPGSSYSLSLAVSGGSLMPGEKQPFGYMLSLSARAGTLTATVIADDNHPQSPPMTILMTVRAINPLSITMPPGMQDGAQTLTLDRRGRTVVMTAIGITGGVKPYRVEALHRIREMRRANIIPSGVSVLISFNRPGAYTISLRISDSAPGEFKTTQTVTLIYHIASRPSAKLTAPTIPPPELFAKNIIAAMGDAPAFAPLRHFPESGNSGAMRGISRRGGSIALARNAWIPAFAGMTIS